MTRTKLQLHLSDLYVIPVDDVDTGHVGGSAVVSAHHDVLYVVLQINQILHILDGHLDTVGDILQFPQPGAQERLDLGLVHVRLTFEIYLNLNKVVGHDLTLTLLLLFYKILKLRTENGGAVCLVIARLL